MSDQPDMNDQLARCANCARVTPVDELREVKNLAERLEPGDTVPDGECPHCGAVAFAIDAIVVCPVCGDDNIVAWYMEPQKSTGEWVREDDGTLAFRDDDTHHGGVDAEFDYYACATNVHELELSEDGKSLIPRSPTDMQHAVERVADALTDADPDLIEAVRTLRKTLVKSGDLVERDRLVEALRDGHRNDSAADQVEFVSDVIGWSAEDDEVLAEESS